MSSHRAESAASAARRPTDGDTRAIEGATSPDAGALTPDPRGRPAVRRTTGWESPELAPAARESAARERTPAVERLFAEARVAFPPAGLLLRGFKREGELELWAASTPTDEYRHVTTFGFCFASGQLGPKRREGDGQVPEGFYTVSYFHPGSRFHLALRLSYPNESDRRLGHPTAPGSDIMIHGKCVSIGCISLGDDRIEELWVAATAARNRGARVAVHLFPARDIGALLTAELPESLTGFWQNLEEGKALFERTHRPPAIRVDASGRYRFD